ncbi:MAG: PC4/YdbC family ssDNA-binding protein [Evtepia sp.]|nr:PC4/YdbC family ssDNA-binding protein [Evtepia sp.]
MQNTAFNYEIVEHIATLSQSGDTSKELNRVSYNGSPAKYDLRSWKRTDGEEKLLKGLTLTDEEATALKEALNGREEL